MKAKVIKIDYLENIVEIAFLGYINLKEKSIIEVKQVKKKRNLNQNSLYRLLCEFVGSELEMSGDEVHEGFKEKHLRKKKIINGKAFEYTGSTTELNTVEFSQYMEKCNRTAIEFGVNTAPFWAEYERYKLGGSIVN